MKRKTPEQALIAEPAFKQAFADAGMPPELRSTVAQILCCDGRLPPPASYPRAFRLARRWRAILDALRTLGCLKRAEPWQRVPLTVALRSCPWQDEHDGRGPTRFDITVRGPVPGNRFELEYRCPDCQRSRGLPDFLGLLAADWEEKQQKEASCNSLLAS